MKKIIVTLLACVLLTGCSQKYIPKDDGPANIVKSYIDAASQAKWETVIPMLSGEALQEMQAGKDRVKTTQKVISVYTDTKVQTDDYAVIETDVVKSNNFGTTKFNNLACYEFRLKKSGDRWLIYKMSQGEIKPSHLVKGTIPVAAREKLITYLELSVAEKGDKDYLYLAGPLLANSERSGAYISQIQPKTKVLEITSVGVSEKYLVAKAIYSVELEGFKPTTITALVDMVDVAGEWKIVRLDIAQTARE